MRLLHPLTMFQRFTSLFFNTPAPPEDSNCPGAFVSEEDEVDGWLIIGLQGEAFVRSQHSDSLVCEAKGQEAIGKGKRAIWKLESL